MPEGGLGLEFSEGGLAGPLTREENAHKVVLI